ncbi:ABC transporter ATP-binding protein [Paenibacillus sp. JX-17]|uniref:ABC transporter ATP-binding protein n=1 Tax=Paenibacillus lacisoli TaxID=3064525 RepID=A0ABT9CED2_9BACL|nr:ABC transporter ATP-binding protein [Paenibacillus sp. JX-17]MDO7907634.1 ABC transporter ATP-binding protein [Paenibacillus sp. JX-17]
MKADQLYFHYPKSGRVLFDHISFSLQHERVNVLAGPNGIGKTTLFDCICGILKPQQGQLEFPPARDIMYLTQNIYFSPEMRGRDFAKLLRSLSGQRSSQDPLDYVDRDNTYDRELITRLWDLKIGRMSVGERKQLFVKMLIQSDRSLYLFDEPTSGVDPSSRFHILRTIQALAASGKTVLMTTHQLHELQELDSHFILLNHGKVQYEGDFQTWLNQYPTQDPDQAFDLAVR